MEFCSGFIWPDYGAGNLSGRGSLCMLFWMWAERTPWKCSPGLPLLDLGGSKRTWPNTVIKVTASTRLYSETPGPWLKVTIIWHSVVALMLGLNAPKRGWLLKWFIYMSSANRGHYNVSWAFPTGWEYGWGRLLCWQMPKPAKPLNRCIAFSCSANSVIDNTPVYIVTWKKAYT